MIFVFDDDATVYSPTFTVYGMTWNWLSEALIARFLKVVVITSQHRDIKTIIAQHRVIESLTSQHRQVKIITGYHRLIQVMTAMHRKIKSFTGG